MAALDFGMALARGMLPKSETAQKDLLNLAGGRQVFKSEDWWNKAVDKQISEGYREIQRTGKEYLMPSGEYQREKTQTSFQSGRYISGPFGGFVPGPSYGGIAGLFGPSGRTVTSYVAPEGALFTEDPRTREKKYTTRDIDIFGTSRKDYTAGELKDIETAAKRGAEEAKRETAASKAGRKRLARGTGGLVGKAVGPDTTGLPSLGSGGLGVTSSLLGTETKL
jgi:hypothetical protein